MTKQVNDTLRKGINFVKEQSSARFEKNVVSYKNVMRWNLASYFLGTTSMIVGLCQTVILELHDKFSNQMRPSDILTLAGPGLSHILMGLELLLSLELSIFPIIVCLYSPTVKKAWMKVKAVFG